MRWTVLLSCGLCLMAISTVDAAELYKCKGESGETVFSDQPCPGGETLPMRETPTYAAPPAPASLTPIKGKEKRPEDIKYVITINQPGADEVIRDNEGRVSIDGVVTPKLYEDHRVRLLLDGVAVGDLKNDTGWSLNDVPRGEHSVIIEVVHRQTGKTVSRSAASTFVLFRQSANQTPDGAGAANAARNLDWPSLGDARQPGDPEPRPPTKPVNTGPRK